MTRKSARWTIFLPVILGLVSGFLFIRTYVKTNAGVFGHHSPAERLICDGLNAPVVPICNFLVSVSVIRSYSTYVFVFLVLVLLLWYWVGREMEPPKRASTTTRAIAVTMIVADIAAAGYGILLIAAGVGAWNALSRESLPMALVQTTLFVAWGVFFVINRLWNAQTLRRHRSGDPGISTA